MNRILYAVLCIGMFCCIPASVIAQMSANFSANNTGGCAPVVVQFTDQSSGNPSTWSWDLGNGTTSSLQNPSTTYTTSGTYTVTLTVSNASTSNTKTITNYITVAAPPVANFVADDSGLVCVARTINFQNTSVSNSTGVTTYLWDFGDGNTSTATNPSHAYLTPGTYNVTLIVTNSNGCSKTIVKTAYVQVQAGPIANVTSSNNIACSAPVTVSFGNISTGATSYTWNFGDGSPTSAAVNPTHTYNSSGNYTVTLIAANTNGCIDTAVMTSFVAIGHPSSSFTVSNTSTCTGVAVSFTNTTTPASINSAWSFGDGTTSNTTSPTHSYAAAGSYTVKLVSTAGACADSATHTVTVQTKPTVSFTANNLWNCTAPFTVQFTNSSTNGASQVWNFGDGTPTSNSANPSHTYNSTGTFTVTLTVTSSNGCVDSLVKPNYIAIGQPVANITSSAASGTCAPAAFSFSVAIFPAITPISSSYNYGDGNTGTTGTHTYTTVGSYTVTYTYTLATGCTYTTSTIVVVGSRPTASFTATPLTTCPGTNVTFTNASTGANSYIWYYGDGTSGIAANPVHSYEVVGSVNVTLIAIGTGGCNDTMTRSNYITVLLPHAQFTPSYTCSNGLQVNFTDNSTGANTWSWTFGDGNTSTSQSPSHIYSTYGNYNVTLTVHNNLTGCNDTYTLPVSLTNSSPTLLEAVDSNTCKNSLVNFLTNNITGATTYQWSFGDGSGATTSADNSQHAYTVSGVYTVRVIVTDSHGCIDTLTKANYVNVGGPTASFTGTPLSGCLPLNVNFTDLSTGTTAFPIFTRTWRYGDGTTVTGSSSTMSHTYTSLGNFTVSLTVTDVNGCTDSMVRLSYVQVTKPHAQFSTNDTIVCTSMNVNFTNSSTGNNLSYQWSFGDGITSFATTPFHAYSNAGAYTVRLIVTDGTTGCSDTMTRTAYINVGSLAASFTVDDSFATCPPLTVNCTNTTSGNNTYTWSFGNGGQSVLPNPTTVYTYPGVYHIKLLVHNVSGCVDSAIRNVAVLGPTGTFSINTYAGCTPLTVLLNVSNTSGATSYTWDLNNGFTQTTTATSFSYTYTTPGKYVPLVVISNGTCQVPVIGDTVRSDHLSADVTFPATSYCTPASVNFTDTSWGSFSGIAGRTWSFGDGGTATGHDPVHIYTSRGTYTVRLIISNVSGCTDTITRTITIAQKPVVTIAGNQPICPGQAAQVTLVASGAATYVWTPGAGLGCATCASTTVLPASTTTYTIVGTSAAGCKDTVTSNVVVNTLPVIGVSPDQTVCANHPAQLTATGGITYVWTPAAGLSCTTCVNPVASPTVTTTYTVTGTNASGCSAAATVKVTINSLPASNLDTNNNICIGRSVMLIGTATGATGYLWYPATGLSCTTCATPIASPAATTHYSLVTAGGNGCNDTAHTVVVVHPLPVVSVPSQAVCAGVPVQVTATGARNYVWSPSAGLSCNNCAAPFVTISANTSYTIIGTDANGCIDTTTATFTVQGRVPTSVNKGDSICYGTTVQLGATGGESYNWTPAAGLSDPHSAMPTVTPGYSITYTVYIKENNCFTDTAYQSVTVYPLPTVSVGSNQTILDGQTVQINVKSSTDVTSFLWTPPEGLSCTDCQSPSATPQRTTTYTLTVTGQGGCKDSAQTTIYLKCQNGQVFIPNIFTPNGDGANDIFYVSGKGIVNVKRFSVYNRWGEEVYHGVDVPVNDPRSGWDGKYNGQLLKPDVFVYVMTVVCETGELLEYKGDVSLIQ